MGSLLIRAEHTGDADAIAGVLAQAFHQHAYQARVVALHRRRSDFDPGLSLLAEWQEQIVGHALFVPHILRLHGADVRAVNLVSLGVDPGFKGRGVGAALIAEGHARARARGCTLSYVIGPPAYYRRFGYREHAFGASSLDLPVAALQSQALITRDVHASDIPALHTLWSYEEQMVDFALDPGYDLCGWVSPNPNIRSMVYLRQRDIVGYTRAHTAHLARPHVFLARDCGAAVAMAASIAEEANAQGMRRGICLPLHPASASAAAFGVPHCDAWGSALARSLDTSPFDEYYARLQHGADAPGRLIWPVEFEVA